MTLLLSSLVNLSVMKEFFFSLKSYNGIIRKSKGCFNEVSRMFHAICRDRKGVSRKFQESFKSVVREF